MIVCVCRVVNDGEIREAIEAGAESVDEITAACGAGGGCGACHEVLARMLHQDGGASPCAMARLRQRAVCDVLRPGVAVSSATRDTVADADGQDGWKKAV